MKSIRVAAAIIKNNNQVFATQRGYGDFIGYWEFPGGKIEKNETPEQAVVREIHEELKTEIEVDKYLCTVEWDYPSFHITMYCYLCSIIGGELTLLEHQAAKWLSLDELNSVDWLPADIIAINALKETRKGRN